MRLTAFILLSVWLYACGSFDKEEPKALFPIKEYGKWGYIDRKGVKIIPCQFDYAVHFYEGLAAVQIDSLWGFINPQGKVVIPPRFIFPGDFSHDFFGFSDGLCAVQLKTDSGKVNAFIKKDGRVAFNFPYRYWEVGRFNSGRARVEINEEVCFLDKRGNIAIKTGFPSGWTFSEGIGHIWTRDSTHYIDTVGRVIVALSGMGHGDFKEGLAVVHDSLDFYIDKTGKKAVTPTISTGDFSDGLAMSYDRDVGSSFIDRSGEIVFRTKYYCAWEFKEGLCAVADRHWGFINKKGEMAIHPRFEQVGSFNNGLCWVKEDHQWGYINTQGEYVWREQVGIQYEKLDLSKWDLDTFMVHQAMWDRRFDGYDNYARQGKFKAAEKLILQVDTNDLTVYQDRFLAYKLYLINGRKDSVKIPIQDGDLKMIQQAQNDKQEWQDLDNFINSFCGHSYRSYKIAPSGYQIFPAAIFKGPFKTKLRFKLELNEQEIFSNVYSGSINKGQLLDPKDKNRTGISVLANSGSY